VTQGVPRQVRWRPPGREPCLDCDAQLLVHAAGRTRAEEGGFLCRHANQGVNRYSLRRHDKSLNMMSAASGREFPKLPGTEGSDLDGPGIGVLLVTGGARLRQQDAQMLFHGLRRPLRRPRPTPRSNPRGRSRATERSGYRDRGLRSVSGGPVGCPRWNVCPASRSAGPLPVAAGATVTGRDRASAVSRLPRRIRPRVDQRLAISVSSHWRLCVRPE
jgi:hypothetical protein